MILFVSYRQCFFYLFITKFIVLFFFVCFEETFVPYRHCKDMGDLRIR